jgi:hypothetical protein
MGAVSNDPSAAIIAVLVILLLALIMRWVFKPARKRPATMPIDASAASADLGLLTVVAAGLSRPDAIAQRNRLGDARIRSSLSRRRDGLLDVLVFRDDADRARVVLGP